MGKMTQTLENTLKGFGVGNYSEKKKKPEVNLFGLRAWTQTHLLLSVSILSTWFDNI